MPSFNKFFSKNFPEIGLGLILLILLFYHGNRCSNNYTENFTTPTPPVPSQIYNPGDPNTITNVYYFYNESCPYCNSFQVIWNNIISKNTKFRAVQLKHGDKGANDLFSIFKIVNVPTILVFYTNNTNPNNTNTYYQFNPLDQINNLSSIFGMNI